MTLSKDEEIDLVKCTFEHGHMCYQCNEECRTESCKTNQWKENNAPFEIHPYFEPSAVKQVKFYH